jgi:hypothetical protein
VPASVVVFEIRVLVEDHEARLPFQVPHERRHAHLRRYPHQHVDVVRHRVGLDDLDALVLAEPPDVLPDVGPQFCIYRFSAIFRSEHDVKKRANNVPLWLHSISVLQGFTGRADGPTRRPEPCQDQGHESHRRGG